MARAFSILFQEQMILLGAKRTMLRSEINDITTLAVGSSHGDFAFDPAFVAGSFNLCCRSQDIKHSYYLYKKLVERNSRLQRLVIFYSLFSPGSVLERSPTEGEIAVIVNALFDLGLNYEDDRLAELSSFIAGKLDDMTINLSGRSGFLPGYGKQFMPASMTAEKRAADHMRFNKRTDAIPYMDMMIDLASRNGHEVLIVVPPARSDFRHFAGSGPELFETLARYTARPKIQVLDLYNHDGFDDSCFGDTDHIIPTGHGSELLSRCVADMLQSR